MVFSSVAPVTGGTSYKDKAVVDPHNSHLSSLLLRNLSSRLMMFVFVSKQSYSFPNYLHCSSSRAGCYSITPGLQLPGEKMMSLKLLIQTDHWTYNCLN